MGISCSSRELRSVATIKVILPNGKLQEFLNPVKAVEVLHENPKCFICSADEMDFNEYFTAINEEEELQQGQLYFVLPLGWLNRRLQAKDMEALAVKASVELSRGGRSGTGGRNSVIGWCCIISGRFHDPLIFCDQDAIDRKSRVVVALAGGGCGGFVRNNGGKELKFAKKLSVIMLDFLL